MVQQQSIDAQITNKLTVFYTGEKKNITLSIRKIVTLIDLKLLIMFLFSKPTPLKLNT